jgi:hypothetical protein
MSMNQNCVKHLWGINFLLLTLAEKTEIKSLSRAIPHPVISQIIKQKTNLCEKI